MKIEKTSKLIVCILARGHGPELVGRLNQEKGVPTTNVSSGRGRGAGPIGSIGAWDEVDVVTVSVSAERADEIFSFIYEAGELGRPRGGIMYQHAIDPVTTFAVPDIEDELPD